MEDASFFPGKNRSGKIPRFLLNDIVRFWRTMAVDYANKHRTRAAEKSALRNIKLRMSRKLLFVSGLFMCLSWILSDDGKEADSFFYPKLVSHLREWTRRSPLESLATTLERYAPDLSTGVFDPYDDFLGLIADRDSRIALEMLSPEEAYQSSIFLVARNSASNFDAALTKLLFESDDRVTRLVQKYGVF